MNNPPANSIGIIILSGGMDSVTLLHHLVKNLDCTVHAISYNYGQKHSKELECAKYQCELLGVEHHIIELPFVNELFDSNLLQSGDEIPEGHYEDENMKQTVVPNRNMIMMSIAVGYGCSKKADWLAIGVHDGDHAIYPDCRHEFIDAFTKAVELCDWHPFTIYAPFQALDKKGILEIGMPLEVDYDHTWTCYKGGDEPCGVCGSCVERDEAFAQYYAEHGE